MTMDGDDGGSPLETMIRRAFTTRRQQASVKHSVELNIPTLTYEQNENLFLKSQSKGFGLGSPGTPFDDSQLISKPAAVFSAISVHHNDVEEEKERFDDDSLEEFKITLALLESTDFDENKQGMERLVCIANSELVNSIICPWSIARLLTEEVPKQNHDAQRLQAALLTYFCDLNTLGLSPIALLQSGECLSDDDDSLASTNNENAGKHNGRLRLAGLRVLASSLQLLASTHDHDGKVELESPFWKLMIQSLSNILEAPNSQRIEAAFAVKCIRLLRELEPESIDSVVQHSMLPYVLHARDFGRHNRCRMLVREAEALLARVAMPDVE